MSCVVGQLGGLCVGAVTTPTVIDATSLPLEILRETLGKREQMFHAQGAIGSRFRAITNVIDDVYTVSGTIQLNPSPTDMDTLWYFIQGGSKTGETFESAQTLPEFSVMVDRIAEDTGATGTWLYEGCKVRRAIFSAGVNNVIALTLEIVAKTETFEGASYPAVSFGSGDAEMSYVFHDVTLTYNTVAFTFERFQLTIENTLDVVYGNSLSATELFEVDHRCFLDLDADWKDGHTASYDIAETTATMTWGHTNPELEAIITFGNLVQLADPPTLNGRGFVQWPLRLEAVSDGASPAVSPTVSVMADPIITDFTADSMTIALADTLTIGQANELDVI